jgi:predicted permease
MVRSLLRRVAGGLQSLFRKAQVCQELDEELDGFLEMAVEEKMKQGMSRQVALRAVSQERGSPEVAKEAVWSAGWESVLDMLWQDLRFAARMLSKNPGFTLVVVLTLGLGIGATSALFSMVEAVLLKPLPYQEASRLAVLWTDNVRQNLHEERTSYPNFEDWRKQNSTFEDMAFASAFTVNLTGGEEPERLVAGRTSTNLFSLMGVKPILGRTFSSEEEKRGDRVIVISHGLWLRTFASSQAIVGRSLEVDGTKMTIVGVMPATFQFPARTVDLWEPLTVFPNWSALRVKRNTPSGFVVGRLKRGVSFSQAQADMNLVGAQLAQHYPDFAASLDFFGFGVNVMPFNIFVTGRQVRVALGLLFGAVLLVLLIACTNVASLLLSRGAVRAREFATRMALGARKKRIVRQLLIESTVMYLISGALGVAFAATVDRLLIRLAPSDIPRLEEAGIDSGVLIFALVLSFLAAFIFGLFPALRVSGTDPHLALKGSGLEISESSAVARLRSLLVAGEFAVSVILLVGAGLLTRSFLRVQHVDPGFSSDHVLTARVVQSKFKSETQWRDFYEQALDHIGAIPGVEAVGAIDNFFFGSFPDEAVTVEGRQGLSSATSVSQVTDDGISPGYFQSLGVPLLRGRSFSEQDGTTSPRTAIINATMSRRFWPDQDPLGKRFKFAYQTAADPWTTVVGVVGDMHRDGVTRDPVSEIFLPLSQHPARGMDLVVRTSADPRSFARAVRAAIRSADKTAPVFDVTTLEDALRDQVAPRRFQTLLLSLFASLAVILSATGVYGLMHYSVTRRTHEIGVRIALGAEPIDVIRLVLEQGGRIAWLGILIGVMAALSIERALSSLLFEVSATDPATFALATLLLCLVALAACCIPALRAANVDPMVALRYE